MTQTTHPTTRVYMTLHDGRRYASAPGAPPAPVYSDLAQNATAYCDCGAKIRLEDTTGRGDERRLTGLEYGIHRAGEHETTRMPETTQMPLYAGTIAGNDRGNVHLSEARYEARVLITLDPICGAKAHQQLWAEPAPAAEAFDAFVETTMVGAPWRCDKCWELGLRLRHPREQA